MTDKIARNETIVREICGFSRGHSISCLSSTLRFVVACQCTQWRSSRDVLAIAAYLQLA